MTVPLVAELHDEVADLLDEVEKQIAEPAVQPLGLLHKGAATVQLRLTPSGHEG